MKAPAATAQNTACSRPTVRNAIHETTPTTTLGNHQHQQESFDLGIDLVEDLNGDFPALERRPGDLHQLALEQVAGGEQEEDEEDDQHRFAGEGRDACRSPHHVLADVDGRFLDLHTLHASRRSAGARGLVGCSLQFLGGALHLLDGAVAIALLAAQRLAQLGRRFRQCRDDVRRIIRERVRE